MAFLSLNAREKIELRDGKYCVLSEDGTKNLGCFDTEAQAKTRLGEVEAFKRAREAVCGSVLTMESVRKISPPCAKKMRLRGIKSIKAEALFDSVLASVSEQAYKPTNSKEAKEFRAASEVAAAAKPSPVRDVNDGRLVATFAESAKAKPDVEGKVWPIRVIKRGQSIQGFDWKPGRLVEIRNLINATEAGAAVLSFRFKTNFGGDIRAHSPKDLEEIGLRESDFVRELQGAVREAWITYDSKGVAEEVWAWFHVTKKDLREELLAAQEAGTLDFYGFSINSKALGTPKPGGGMEMNFVANLPSVDLVNFPSAGGKLFRAVAAAVPSAENWARLKRAAASKKQTITTSREQGMTWQEIVMKAAADAGCTDDAALAVFEAVKDKEGDQAALALALEVCAGIPNATESGHTGHEGETEEEKKKREEEEERRRKELATAAESAAKKVLEAAGIKGDGAAMDKILKGVTEAIKSGQESGATSASELKTIVESVVNKAMEPLKKNQDKAAAEAWSSLVDSKIKARTLNESEAKIVRESCKAPSDPKRVDALIDDVLKVRESAGWPKGRLPALGIVVGDDKMAKVMKGLKAMMKKRPLDGVRPIRSFREAYSILTGVISPSATEVFAALAHMGRYLNAFQAKAVREGRCVTEDERREISVKESAMSAAIFAEDHKFEHVREVNAREATINLAQFPQAFANVIHNELQDLYQIPSLNEWRLVGGTEIVDDFRSHDVTRVGGYGGPAIVAESAAYGTATTPDDEAATATVAKRGDLETITLEAVANDVLDVIRRIPSQFIGAAVIQMVQAFWDEYKNNAVTTYDGVAWFAAGHANILTGTAATVAMNITNLNLARRKMRQQKELSSGITFLSAANVPKYIVAPANLEDEAFKFTQRLRAEANLFENENRLHRDITPIIVDHWDTGVITNSWFTQGNPELVGFPIDVLFFETDSPELFQEDVPTTGRPFTNDEIRLKRRWAWATRVIDHRQVHKFNSTT